VTSALAAGATTKGGTATKESGTAGGRRAGRPRRIPARGGLDPREEILAVSAELFSSAGYLSTTTRQIAAKVGITQSSLYSHFARKEDILAILLERTLDEILALRDWMAPDRPRCDVALWTLVCHDARTLCAGPTNIASLLLVPEVRSTRFESMWAKWHQLQDLYRDLVSEGVGSGVFVGRRHPSLSAHLVFNLTGTMVWFDQAGSSADVVARDVADAALRMMLARPGQLAAAARKGEHPPAAFGSDRAVLADGD
jgi:AcrR family transcriptional regulator